MSKPAISIADNLTGHLRTLEKSREKLERLSDAGHVTPRDMTLFYEGIFLKTVTAFESLLEKLFIGLLTGGIEPGRNVHPRAQFKSPAVARDIICGGRAYVDWLPYHHTEKRAAAFFRGGRPFSRLDKKDKKTLERMLRIRNAVAHQSRAARSEFDKIIASVPLLPAVRTPPGFLRSVFALAPPRTHYQDIAGTCSLLARKLTR